MSAFRSKADMAFCADLRFAVAIRGKVDMTLCGAGQAPRGVRGGHKRDGIDDPVRELRFTFRTEIFLVIVQQSCFCCSSSTWRRGDSAMPKTYREIAIEEMLGTVQEAMSQVIDWWGDLPPEMNEAIEQFRTELGAAIDSVEFVKKALDRQVHETDHGRGPA